MKQKVVIEVSMSDDKTRSKAMRIAVSVSGTESASIVGKEKNKIQVIGEGIDAVALTRLLRKKVGFAVIDTVGPATEPKKETTTDNKITSQPWIWTPSFPPYAYGVPSNYQNYELYRSPNYDPNCRIM